MEFKDTGNHTTIYLKLIYVVLWQTSPISNSWVLYKIMFIDNNVQLYLI